MLGQGKLAFEPSSVHFLPFYLLSDCFSLLVSLPALVSHTLFSFALASPRRSLYSNDIATSSSLVSLLTQELTRDVHFEDGLINPSSFSNLSFQSSFTKLSCFQAAGARRRLPTELLYCRKHPSCSFDLVTKFCFPEVITSPSTVRSQSRCNRTFIYEAYFAHKPPPDDPLFHLDLETQVKMFMLECRASGVRRKCKLRGALHLASVRVWLWTAMTSRV